MPALRKKQPMTKPNAPEDITILAYHDADRAYKAAEVARKDARAEVDKLFLKQMAEAPHGLSMIHESRFVQFMVTKKNSGSSVDRTQLFNTLTQELKLSSERASQIIEMSSKERAPQTVLQVIKREV